MIHLIGFDELGAQITKKALIDLDHKLQMEEEMDNKNLQKERDTIFRIVTELKLHFNI